MHSSAKPAITYVGDIQDKNAEPVPFRVAAPDGIDGDAKQQLDDHRGIAFVDDLRQAQAAIIRSKTKFPSPKDLANKFSGDPDAHSFADYEALQYVVRSGDGHDNIDKKEACTHAVATENTPGVSTRDVALQTTAFILAWACRVPDGTAGLKQHKWQKKTLLARELGEMTLGVIGHGNIGTTVEGALKMYFKHVQYYDIDPEKSNTETLEQLLATSDVVTIHINGKQEVLTPERIAQMRRTQLLVNTARGTNVNNSALLERLNAGDGFMYASDVYRQEPPDFPQPKEDHPGDAVATAIIDHPNFFGTPHIASSRIGNQRNLGRIAVARVLAYAEHGHVNPDDIPGHTFPRIVLDPRDVPGIRGVVFHENSPGKLKAIYTALSDAGMNIRGDKNDHSRINGNTLAMTQFDLEPDVSPTRACSVMREIQAQTSAFRTRLLAYTASTPSGT